ncbi:MAG: pyridoxamine 5'-phosphate oxidase family protein [Leptolyngbyaceae cyanobacterium SL_7_1]|nr:pyridoxamine 5'-phosphate oxidase family protein [Leptolyngbyaceae cyanobacterium SL_7_1]
MAKFYPELTDSLQRFIGEQKLFFTATAPTNGRVNLSPKGIDTFRCLDRQTVAYLDLTGSGNETSAHLQENGRITLMFCSFGESPLILRIYGQGEVVRSHHPQWQTLYPHFSPTPGERQIIVIQVQSAQTSCGHGVPVYEFQRDREEMIRWAEKKGEAGLQQYWHDKNQVSIDGLPTGIGQTNLDH